MERKQESPEKSPSLEDLLLRYGLIMHRRFYDREKRRFLVALSKELASYGYKTQIKMTKHGQFKIRNLYIGNIEKAKMIFTTYYDTPTIGMSSYQPLEKKTKSLNLINFLPLTIIMIAGAAFISTIAQPNWSQNWFSTASLLSIVISFALFGLLLHFRRGIATRKNIIQNTSSILAIIELARKMDNNRREKCAFVLTDFGIANHFGETLISQQLPTDTKDVSYVRFDSVGAGGEVKKIKQSANKIIITSGSKEADDKVVVSRKLKDTTTTKMLENIRESVKIGLELINSV